MNTVDIETPDGLQLRIPDDDHLTRQFEEGIYEADLIDRARELTAESSRKTIVDVGAHVGGHTLRFAQFARHVFSFEPHPELYRMLVQNFNRNLDGIDGAVDLHNMALGKEQGTGRIVEADGNSGASQIVRLSEPNEPRIPIETLDDMIWPRAVSLIKIDVEGMEVDVLRGAIKTIDTYRPELFVECGDGTELDDVLGVLEQAKYEPIDQYATTPTWHLSSHER